MKLAPIVSAIALAIPSLGYAASYEVQELPYNTTTDANFAVSIDNTGLMLSTLSSFNKNIADTAVGGIFNPPVDLTLFDPENFNLEDEDSALEGNFTARDLSLVARIFLDTNATNNPFGQKLADNLGYQSDGVDIGFVNGFDEVQDSTNGFTLSLESQLAGSANGTHIVGTMAGPFRVVDYTTADNENITYVVNDFIRRGFVQVGSTTVELPPEYDEIGGFSAATAINSNLQVAGVMSVGASDTLTQLISNCQSEELRGDQALEACYYRLMANNLIQNFLTSPGFLYDGNRGLVSRPQSSLDIVPVMWQLDATGQIISTQKYEPLFRRDVFDSSSYNRPLDINTAGAMAGFSTVESPRITNRLEAAAAIFENGETIRLLEDDELLPNYATGINDNDYVVGFLRRIVNGSVRNRMFVFDRSTEELTTPDGFFVSSSTHPRAINNNNLVVGDAEVGIVSQNISRPTVGFLYNIDTQEFTDLNDLLPCDSPYNIINAKDINDAGVILADAQVRRDAKNIKGEVLTGDAARKIDTVVTVKLSPTGAQPVDCNIDEEEFQERQGASVSTWLMTPLLLVAWLRRRLWMS